MKHQRTFQRIAFLIIVIALWLPRGLALDQFVTIDENRWLTRAANFHRALAHGEYAHTYQHGHPGVTIMWLGTAGYLWRYPDYANDAPGEFGWENSEFEEYLRTQAHDALDLLEAGRTFAVLANVLALGLAYLAAVRLLGTRTATVGFLFIAFDPFEVALSRFLHLDGLLSSWMLLALLLYLCFLYRGRRRRDLFGAGVAAGLAWLTKTPGLFLMPIVGLLALWELVLYWRTASVSPAWLRDFGRRALAPALLWAVVALGLYVLLWPAMWVDPVGTVQKVLAISSEYATEGHSNPLFFRGEIIHGDPGWIFYPLTWLWRLTPVVMVGVVLGVFGLWRPYSHMGSAENVAAGQRNKREIVAGLLLFAMLFLLLMNLGAKKLDRYLVPTYPALALVAAHGFDVAGRWLAAIFFPSRRSRTRWMVAGVGALVALQLALLLPTFPYYMSYYNPLLGGGQRAATVLTLGWGEGLDQAARYLKEENDEAATRIAAWYRTGPFDYFYHGSVISPQYYWFADYIVTYVNQWQRQMPARQLVGYLASLPAEQEIVINGTEYARIYDLRTAPVPPFVTDWGDVIRLISYTMPSGDVQAGQTFDVVLQLVNLAPIDANLNLLLRIVNQAGEELVRYEWRPAGIATVDWNKDELWHHRTTVAVPPDATPGLYRVEVAFFNPDTQVRLPAVQSGTARPIGNTLVLDYLTIAGPTVAPATPLEPPADLAGKVRLLGSTVTHTDGASLAERPLRAGDELVVRAFWQTLATMTVDYTAFGHLVGPGGQLATQHDRQPLAGFVPTSLWYPGQIFVDEYRLTLPATAMPGDYPLHMGMYDLATVTRLPVTRAGESTGDSVVATVLQVAGD